MADRHDQNCTPLQLSRRKINLANSDADEFKAQEGCLPSETLRSILRAPVPSFNVEVKVNGSSPSLASPLHLVRGHCPHFSCNTTHPIIDWAKSGPENFGKVLRPYCQACSTESIKRYLDLFFYLELMVTDSSNNEVAIVIQRECAMRFLGCTVHKFLLSEGYRSHIVRLLYTLVKKCNLTSHTSGMSISLCVVPVAINQVENVQFYLFGDNMPLFALVEKTC